MPMCRVLTSPFWWGLGRERHWDKAFPQPLESLITLRRPLELNIWGCENIQKDGNPTMVPNEMDIKKKPRNHWTFLLFKGEGYPATALTFPVSIWMLPFVKMNPRKAREEIWNSYFLALKRAGCWGGERPNGYPGAESLSQGRTRGCCPNRWKTNRFSMSQKISFTRVWKKQLEHW